jgi:hypothetical protein
MVRQKMFITESERDRIRGLYNVPTLTESNDFVITDWLSPDEKFVIFLDELYDISNKVKIGNIWENFDNFKFFLKHSFEVAKDIPETIKESVLSSISGLVLTESNQDIRQLKPIVKEMLLNEGLGDWAKGAGDWIKDTASGAVKNTTEFVSKSLSGVQKLVGNISVGQWSEVVKLIGSGALYVARKIRSALYNPVGLILDAILVATGIGKGAQFVIWGIVVALDVYELISGNYEEKDENLIKKLIFFGIDIIGLVTTGIAAKSSKTFIGPLLQRFGSSISGMSKAVKASPKLKGILESMMSYATLAKSSMSKVTSFLQKKSPMMYKFVSGILGGLGSFVAKLISTIKSVLGATGKVISAPGKAINKALGGGKLGAGVKAGTETTALAVGIGAYSNNRSGLGDKSGVDNLTNTISNSNSEFDGI